MHNGNFSFFWILNFYHFESKKKDDVVYYSARYKLFFFSKFLWENA